MNTSENWDAKQTGTSHDAVASHPCSCSVSWLLAEN